MDISHQWLGSHYAAVAGRFDTCREASAILADHLVKAYPQEISEKGIKQQGNHYSLYWSAPGAHQSTRAIDGLASLVQQAANADAPVHWLVHGDGARTFASALEILKTSASANPQRAPELATAMKKQKVVFSNPRGATEARLKTLCQEAGVEFVKANINKRDYKSIAAWRNNYSDIVMLLGGMATTGVVATLTKPLSISGLQSSGAQLVEALGSAVGDPTAAKVTTALAAAFAVGKASHATYKAMNGTFRTVDAIAKSTFGRGSHYWYEDDGKLLKAMRG